MAMQLPYLSSTEIRRKILATLIYLWSSAWLPCLLRMGLCHDAQAAPVSVEDGTLSQSPSSSGISRGWDFVTMAKQFPYLSRMGLCHDGQGAPVSVKKRKKKKNVSNINLSMEFSMAPVSVEDGTLPRWPCSSRICQAQK